MDREIKTYKDFGLNKKQGLYCEYRIQNYNKRKSYMKAFNVENPDVATTKCWEMEQKVGDKLNEYMYYLESLHQEEFIMSLRQLQEMWVDLAKDEKTSNKDKLKALELYGKSIGAFVENINVDAKVEQVVFENEDDIPE